MRRSLVVAVSVLLLAVTSSAVALAADPCIAANGEVRRASDSATCEAEGTGSVAIAVGDGAYAGVWVPWWGQAGSRNHAIAIGESSTAVVEFGSGNQMLAIHRTSGGGGDGNFVMGGLAYGDDNWVITRSGGAYAQAQGSGNTAIASGSTSFAFASGNDNIAIASGVGSQAFAEGEGNTAIASGDGACAEGGWCEGGGAAFATGTDSTAIASGDGICTGASEWPLCEANAWAQTYGGEGNVAVASGDGSLASAGGGSDNTAIASGTASTAIADGEGCTAIAAADWSTVTCP